MIHPESLKQLYPILFDLIFKLKWSWGNFGFNRGKISSYCKNLWYDKDGN
ncbi:hypothetical protein LCGC14_1237030 [marine sediment metagenome]|uniref:Uncharacterized protein n=1 Tax=marine sediment metagenome TaxID=412755 RepID=A0A0F9PB46_9ZZZZ